MYIKKPLFSPFQSSTHCQLAGALVEASKMMNFFVVVQYLPICLVAVNANKCTTGAVKRIKHNAFNDSGQGKLNRKLSSASSIATVLALTQALIFSFSYIKMCRCQGKVMRLSFSFFPCFSFIPNQPFVCLLAALFSQFHTVMLLKRHINVETSLLIFPFDFCLLVRK